MIRFIRILAVIVLALLAELLLPRYVSRFFRQFDFFLMVVVFHSINQPRIRATLVGTVCGLVEDAFTGFAFGLHGFTKTIVGYLTSSFFQRFMIDTPLMLVVVLTVATALQEGIHFILTSLLFGAENTSALFPDILIMMACNAVGGVLLMRLAIRLSGRLSAGRMRGRGVSRISR